MAVVPMTIENALCCKVGSLVHMVLHGDVVDEWCHLCGFAMTFGHVEHELQIHSCMSRQRRLDASSGAPIREEGNPSAPADHPSPTGERGDAGAHDFWQRGRITIFDVRVMDTQFRPCLEMWKDFTPHVYSASGITGREAENAEMCLAHHLSEWHKPHSQMVYYVRV